MLTKVTSAGMGSGSRTGHCSKENSDYRLYLLSMGAGAIDDLW